jgi:GT2 family glycosyltransferase
LPPGVSIITVYYNTPEDLLRLFQSAVKYLKKDSFEFIVADNDSKLDLSGNLYETIYLRLTENYGFGRASNLAAAKASAPYLFFVNPDCEFIQDCTRPLLETMNDSAVAGPKVLNEDGSIQLSFGPYLSILSEARQKRLMHSERSVSVQNWLKTKTSARFHPDYVSGCAMMVRADVFRKVNGFDEKFFLYNEDVDLCKRMHNLGYKITFEPTGQIVHYRNRSVCLVPEKVKAEYRKSQLYYYEKHQSAFQNLLLKLYLCTKMEQRGHSDSK